MSKRWFVGMRGLSGLSIRLLVFLWFGPLIDDFSPFCLRASFFKAVTDCWLLRLLFFRSKTKCACSVVQACFFFFFNCVFLINKNICIYINTENGSKNNVDYST